MRRTAFYLSVALLAFCVCQNTYAQKKTVEASFCKISLSEHTIQSNITFSNRYFFRIGINNRPIKISRIIGYDFIDDEEVKECVNGWTFKNFAENTSVIIEISWQHGVGWQPIQIRSKGFSKNLKPL